MKKIIFEPFRIKVVEPISISTEEQRRTWIEQAGYNVFNLRAEQVIIDLLTDSGTSAMSQEQWSAIQSGDESYAGSRSFYLLEECARDIFQKKIIIPVHQGRAGEHLVFSVLVRPGDIIPSNSHFDTTGANVMDNGGQPLNLPCPEAKDIHLPSPFKGNMDLDKLATLLETQASKVPFVMMTITNNTGGGQPVSLENMKQVRALCDRFSKPLIIDSCRFAENAYLIKQREAGQASRSAKEIAQEVLGLGTINIFSAKKDALANIGGLVCLDDEELAEQLKNRLIITEGFATYGGLAGRDLAAIAQGLDEVVNEDYLRYRVRTIEWMIERLVEAGVPVVVPSGGHALYVDARGFFPDLKPSELPGIALTSEMYIRAGVRGVELGNVAFGTRDDAGNPVYPPQDLVRFAIPRRVYTEAHADYVVEHLIALYAQRDTVKGFRFLSEAPVMRHFRSTFERLA